MSAPRTLRSALGLDVPAPPCELNWTAQWFADDYPPKAAWGSVAKFVVHFTETPSRSRHGSRLWAWPGYDAGAKAPNWTLMPDCGRQVLMARAHFPVASSARALRNSSAPGETNAAKGGLFQVEIVGTCDRAKSREWQRRDLVPGVDYVESWNLPGWVRDGIARLWVWLHRGWGVPLVLGSTLWPAYPSSPALDRRARMSREEFDRARGIIGHLHVPDGNRHLDPGDFPAADILRRALTIAGQCLASPQAATPQEDDVTPDDIQKIAAASAEAVWTHMLPSGIEAPKTYGQPAAKLMALAAAKSLQGATAADKAVALVAALDVVSGAVGDLSPEEVQALIEAGVTNVLGKLGAALDQN